MSERVAMVEGEGAGAAALVAAGVGSFVLGVLTAVTDHAPHLKAALNWWKPTGPLSGVTTLAILVWLACWLVLHAIWKSKPVDMRSLGLVAVALLLVGFALTFPPIIDAL